MEQNEQEASTIRNTHFRNWATQLYQDLQLDLFRLFMAWTTWGYDEERIELAALAVKNTLAQHGYELVEHAVEAMKPSIYTNAFTPDTLAEIARFIPDTIERPVEPD